ESSIENDIPSSTESFPSDSRRTGFLIVLSSCAVTLLLTLLLATVLLDPFGSSDGIEDKMAIEAESLQDFSTAAGTGD
ncbi:MAG: hypothetical protein O3A84_12950, partial [Proteobacteria bacterium]|nr:hypothetical protein [Pseudomonadota bacterium]